MPSPDDVAEILRLCQLVRDRPRQGCLPSNLHVTAAALRDSPYALSISISDAHSTKVRRPVQRCLTNASTDSAASSISRQSDLFDTASDDGASISSVATDISLNGEEPAQPTAGIGTALSSIGREVTVPCEFFRLDGCRVRGSMHAMDRLVDHTALHLRGNFPEHTACWFCDEVFDVPHALAQSSFGSAEDNRVACYRSRMVHIMEHFRDEGFTDGNVRPEFFFLNHVWDHGLISEAVYEEAKKQTELDPRKGFLKNLEPLSGAPQEKPEKVIESHRSRRGGPTSSSPRRPERPSAYYS